MPTIRDGGHVIGSQGGDDYSDISNWIATENGIDGDLVTGDEILQGKIRAETYTNTVNTGAWTTSSTNYIEMIPYDAGSYHDGTPGTGPIINVNSASGGIRSEEVIRISGLEINNANYHAIILDYADDGYVERCICKSEAGYGIFIYRDVDNFIIRNNIVYECALKGIGVNNENTTSNISILCNTVADCTQDGIYTGGTQLNNDVLISHNVCSGNGNGSTYFDYALNATQDTGSGYNASLDGSEPGDTGDFQLSGDPFLDSTNDDYRIDSDSELYNAGDTSLSNVSDDCIGTSRPQGTNFDVGAFEAMAAQTVSPTAASARGSTTSPAVTLGSLTIAPTARSALGSSTAPTAILGAITTAPSAASAIAASVTPTAVLGSLTIAPTTATAIGSTTLEAVLTGGQTATPAAATALGSTTAPTAILGAITTAPSAASAIAASVIPIVVLGSLTIAPTAATAIGSTTLEAVLTSGQTATPAAATALGSTTAPTAILGAIITAPNAASAIAASVTPTAVLGSLTTAPTAATAIGSTTLEAVLTGEQTATPAAATAVGSTVAPDAILGAITIAPSAASAIAATATPTAVLGSITVAPAAAAALGSTTLEAVLTGEQAITPTAAAAIGSTLAPSLVFGGFGHGPPAAIVVGGTAAATLNFGSATFTPMAITALGSTILGAAITEGTAEPAAATARGSALYERLWIGPSPRTDTAVKRATRKRTITRI